MRVELPQSLPPVDIAEKVLPYLCNQLTTASNPAEHIPTLQVILSLLARSRLSNATPFIHPPSLIPIHVILSLAATNPHLLTPTILIDALIAYPSHAPALAPALSEATVSANLLDTVNQVIPLLVSRINSAHSPEQVYPPTRVLHALLRGNDLLASCLLRHSDSLITALRGAYERLRHGEGAGYIRAKSEASLLTRELVSRTSDQRGEEDAKRQMGPNTGHTTLIDKSLRGDYEIFHGSQVGGGELARLRKWQEDDRWDDPRLRSLQSTFPGLPSHLLLEALYHPDYAASASNQTSEEQTAPLVQAIVSGGSDLPVDLVELRETINLSKTDKPVQPKIERHNIWDDELDMSRLRLKEDNTPVVGYDIPDHLRASILRLVETQAEEAEAEERALREAHGSADALGPSSARRDNRSKYYDDWDDDLPSERLRIGADGEESGDDDYAGRGSKANSTRSASPPPELAGPSATERENQALLELAYLRDKSVFARDSATRRSAARRALRDATGMDDGQLEGWMIMLERNPHKDALLGRHQWSGSGPRSTKPKKEERSIETGSTASGSSRGGGRGRGRGASKGSRGHSNAARTRGHDRKMTRMGAGA